MSKCAKGDGPKISTAPRRAPFFMARPQASLFIARPIEFCLETQSFFHSNGPLRDDIPTDDSHAPDQAIDQAFDSSRGLPLTPTPENSSMHDLWDFDSTFDRPMRHLASRAAPKSRQASCIRSGPSRNLTVSWHPSSIACDNNVLIERYKLPQEMFYYSTVNGGP